MKKIFQIYLADLKRISTNVVAIVIIMGLCIIPALYAWFNIMSNWDPYGEEATSQMHIAVYSEDEGMSIGDLKLCMGDSVIKGLKENDAIGWIFTDSSKEALEYVYSGKCYAAFIVPKDFSADMLSFLSGEPVNPQIEYKDNLKGQDHGAAVCKLFNGKYDYKDSVKVGRAHSGRRQIRR